MPRTAPVFPEVANSHRWESVMRRFDVANDQLCRLLVDAAQFEENAILQALYALDDNPSWCWLFEESELASHAKAGPIVVDTTINSRFMQHAVANWSKSGLVLLMAETATNMLLTSLRKALTANLQTFGPTVLRAYDTRFLQIISACQPDRLATLVGPEATWLWSVDMPSTEVWQGFKSENPTQSTIGNYDRDFERLLGWVSGWLSCANSIPANIGENAEHLTAFIVQQYEAGQSMPEDNAFLELLWHEYQRTNATLPKPKKWT